MNSNKKYISSVKDMSVILLDEGKSVRIKAHGYSMYPAIKPGSLIFIEPLREKGRPVPGEIVAIKRENGIVVHRVMKRYVKDGVTWYVTRGDSNSRSDKPIQINKIAGRIIKAEATGENPKAADVRINTNPTYIFNRLRVISIFVIQKLKKAIK